MLIVACSHLAIDILKLFISKEMKNNKDDSLKCYRRLIDADEKYVNPEEWRNEEIENKIMDSIRKEREI